MKRLILCAAMLAMLALTVAAQVRPPDAGFQSGPKIDPATARAYNPPKTADGHPDLEGIWQPRAGGAAYSILPHPAGFFLGAGSETGIVEGGELPYQPWAAERIKYLTQHMELDPTGHCHYEGIPHAMYFAFQIFQIKINQRVPAHPR